MPVPVHRSQDVRSPSAAFVPQRGPVPAGGRRAGTSLVRELRFRDFDQATPFLQKLAASAEDHFRRPDMCVLDFNHVRLMISNPNHAGLTEFELRLAEKVSAVIDR